MCSKIHKIVEGPSIGIIYLASIMPKIFLAFTLENSSKIYIHPDTCNYNENLEIIIEGKIKNYREHNLALITYNPDERNGYVTIFSK